MSEENEAPDYEAQLKEANETITTLKSDTASMQSKMDELLTETKKAKAARREEHAASVAESERTAKEKGDFEQLYKSSEDRYNSTVEELNGLKTNIATQMKTNAAMKIAATISDGNNADLLSEFIAKRLTFKDDSIKVVDKSGNLTVSTIEDLTNEFLNDARYSSLLKGSQASGGGATGSSSNGSGAANTLSRAEFDALNAVAAHKFMSSGGQLTD